MPFDEVAIEEWDRAKRWIDLPLWSELSIAGFKASLESVPRLGQSVFDAVRPVVPEAAQDTSLHDDVASAVICACYGAAAYSYDWRARRHAEQLGFAAGRREKAKDLALIRGFLELHSEFCFPAIAEMVEQRLRDGEYSGLRLPAPRETFIIDILTQLAQAIEECDILESQSLDHARARGCLEYGKPLRERAVNLRSMLAFNLEVIFRGASRGSLISEGQMPTAGLPHRPLNARLLNAMFSRRHDPDTATAATVSSVIKSILRNEGVRLIPWTLGPDGPPTSSQ